MKDESSKSNKKALPRDYKAWDKFNVEEELEKVDEQEEAAPSSTKTKSV